MNRWKIPSLESFGILLLLLFAGLLILSLAGIILYTLWLVSPLIVLGIALVVVLAFVAAGFFEEPF
jgi:hypothetical protein